MRRVCTPNVLYDEWGRRGVDEKIESTDVLSQHFVKLITSHPLVAFKCVLWLYEKQTDEERAFGCAVDQNRVGFCKTCAPDGTRIAREHFERRRFVHTDVDVCVAIALHHCAQVLTHASSDDMIEILGLAEGTCRQMAMNKRKRIVVSPDKISEEHIVQGTGDGVQCAQAIASDEEDGHAFRVRRIVPVDRRKTSHGDVDSALKRLIFYVINNASLEDLCLDYITQNALLDASTVKRVLTSMWRDAQVSWCRDISKFIHEDDVVCTEGDHFFCLHAMKRIQDSILCD